MRLYLYLVAYDLAEGGTLLDVPVEDLPANWRQVPEPAELKPIRIRSSRGRIYI